MSRITTIYRELLRRAQETSTDRATNLGGGARLAVHVTASHTTLTIARKQKPVGTAEEVVFRRDCAVPEGAQRIPATGQQERTIGGVVWHLIGYRWAHAGEEMNHA